MQLQIRNAIVAFVSPLFQAAFPDVMLVHQNDGTDQNNLPAFFVRLDIEFFGGEQVGIEANPRRRVSGYVYVEVWARHGTGVTRSHQVMDWFANTLKFARIPPVLLEAPEPDPNDEDHRGYYVMENKFSFRSDPG